MSRFYLSDLKHVLITCEIKGLFPLLLHSSEVLGSNPPSGLSVWSLHVLSLWVQMQSVGPEMDMSNKYWKPSNI